ncbi:glucokinase [Kipferlia bialata]|uniref:Glucokinase n=1 Tax=Kipferlia bialata TaxID=797122 RepID=A0A9K3CSY9_9EUKA|nr:glucokinase [Kipferlia bialata]|eukprot:g3146.t1
MPIPSVLVLAGDVGGTNARFALSEVVDGDKKSTVSLFDKDYPTGEGCFTDVLRQFMSDAAAALDVLEDGWWESTPPSAVCLAIAGPIDYAHNSTRLTNDRNGDNSWDISAQGIADSIEGLDADRIKLINDFSAIGYGIPGLNSTTDIATLFQGTSDPSAPIAIVGAGTVGAGTGLGMGYAMQQYQYIFIYIYVCVCVCLGMGYAMQQESGWTVYPSEGGHAPFAPISDPEFKFTHWLMREHPTGVPLERVSWERIASGIGLRDLFYFYRSYYARSTDCISPQLAGAVAEAEAEGRDVNPLVSSAARASACHPLPVGEADPVALHTMHTFVRVFAAASLGMALTVLPKQGLYLAGGISPRLLDFLSCPETGFVQAFHTAGRLRHQVENIPIHVILNDRVGLLGASLYAASLI